MAGSGRRGPSWAVLPAEAWVRGVGQPWRCSHPWWSVWCPRPHSSSQHTRRLLVVPLSSPGSLIPLPPVGDGIKRPSLGRRVAHPRDTTELICTYTTCLEEGRVDTRGTGAMGKTCEAPWESWKWQIKSIKVVKLVKKKNKKHNTWLTGLSTVREFWHPNSITI